MLCAMLSSSTLVIAQDEPVQTLAGLAKPIRIQAYGGVTTKLTQFNREVASINGIFGGVVFNRQLYVGVSAFALTSNILQPGVQDVKGCVPRWNMGYGGLTFEYIHASNKLLHLTAGTLIGAGEVKKNWTHSFKNDSDRFFDKSIFFVIEPSVNAELNMSSWFRIALGGSYRLVSGSHTPGITDSGLSAPTATLSLKFGRF